MLRPTLKLTIILRLRLVIFVVLVSSCAPRPAPRAPLVLPPPSPQPSQPLSSSPRETERRPVLEEAKIKEQGLPGKRPAPLATPKSPSAGSGARGTEIPPLPPRNEASLIAKITPKTLPQRAASLRLTEEGRKLLESGDYPKALARLEKTLTIDSTNPYGYFYLAQAHYYLAHYQESLNFLDVAESLLSGQTYWLAEVFALRGENFRALGVLPRADFNYAEALRLNPGNPVAAEGIGKIRNELPVPPR